MTSPWAVLAQPRPKADLWTPDEIASWLQSRGLKGARAEYHQGIGSVRITANGVATVITLPVPRSTLTWIYEGKP